MLLMPRKGQKGRYNYGRQFSKHTSTSGGTKIYTKVQYRYLNGDKKTKTLVDARTKKPVTGKTSRSTQRALKSIRRHYNIK